MNWNKTELLISAVGGCQQWAGVSSGLVSAADWCLQQMGVSSRWESAANGSQQQMGVCSRRVSTVDWCQQWAGVSSKLLSCPYDLQPPGTTGASRQICYLWTRMSFSTLFRSLWNIYSMKQTVTHSGLRVLW